MFDGVGWAAGEIVAFMLMATVIGLVTGWVIGRWLLGGTIAGEFERELKAQQERVERAEAIASSGREELEEARLELQAERSRLGDLEVQVASARAAAGELEERLGAAADRDLEIERLAGELEAVADLEVQLEDKSKALAEARSEIERLSAGLEEAVEAAERTSGRLVEQESLLQELAELRGRAAEADRLQAEVASGTAERERLQTNLGILEAELTETRALLGAAGTIDDTPLDTAAAPPAAESIAQETIPADHLGVAAPERLTKAEGIARMADVAARTAGDGPIPDDDLKKVRGIGPKLERTLKDLGITSFRQIANFQPGDIAVVTAALDAFRGRIERDDWMSSAAELHLKEYGKPAMG